MRARLNRTLLLRQRLCAHPAQPFRQWASEPTRTRVSTIHSFAQELIAEFGARAGYSRSLRVGSPVMQLHRLVREALSPHLTSLYASSPGEPAEWEWQKHVEAVWTTVENRAPLMKLYGPAPPEPDLGIPADDAPDAAATSITSAVLTEVANRFASHCREEEVVPIAHLVPVALAVLRETADGEVARIRHVFVDEFQDTDVQQISLLIELMRASGSKAFLVDVKQGIDRFRGAAGDAFKEVAAAFRQAGEGLEYHSTVKNFRSTPALLADMDDHFRQWRDRGLLKYHRTLTPMRPPRDPRSGVVLQAAWSEEQSASAAAEKVAEWRKDDPTLSIRCSAGRTGGTSDEERLGGSRDRLRDLYGGAVLSGSGCQGVP